MVTDINKENTKKEIGALDKIFSVTEFIEFLNIFFKQHKFRVVGEISQFKRQNGSGHCYFEGTLFGVRHSQLSCWRHARTTGNDTPLPWQPDSQLRRGCQSAAASLSRVIRSQCPRDTSFYDIYECLRRYWYIVVNIDTHIDNTPAHLPCLMDMAAEYPLTLSGCGRAECLKA